MQEELKGELFKILLFLYMKHFKCIPLVFSHQNVFYLIKPAIVFSENKVLPKNLFFNRFGLPISIQRAAQVP